MKITIIIDIVVIVLQYIQISNHYAVLLKLNNIICQLYLNKKSQLFKGGLEVKATNKFCFFKDTYL